MYLYLTEMLPHTCEEKPTTSWVPSCFNYQLGIPPGLFGCIPAWSQLETADMFSGSELMISSGDGLAALWRCTEGLLITFA
jgi:hypothetical protein